MIFTLFFGLLAVICRESRFKLWQRILLVILCNAATVLIYSDRLIFGVLFILILHIFQDRPKLRLTLYTSLALVHCLLDLFSLGKVPAFKLITYSRCTGECEADAS